MKKLLANGTYPGNVLGKKAYCINWDIITSIYSNKKLRAFTIYFNAGEAKTKVLTPEDAETRDEIFEAIAAFLEPEWELTTRKHTPLTATFTPLISIATTVVITILFAFLAHNSIERVAERFAKGERVVTVGKFEHALITIGPVWTGVIGLVFAIGMTIWLMVRVLVPPIDMNICRASKKPAEEEDD